MHSVFKIPSLDAMHISLSPLRPPAPSFCTRAFLPIHEDIRSDVIDLPADVKAADYCFRGELTFNCLKRHGNSLASLMKHCHVQ